MPRLHLLIALLAAAFAGAAPAAWAQGELTVPTDPPPLTAEPGPAPDPVPRGDDPAPGDGDTGSSGGGRPGDAGSGDGGSGGSGGAGGDDPTGGGDDAGGSGDAATQRLPDTGADTAALLLLGTALVLGGAGLRLRTGDPHGRP